MKAPRIVLDTPSALVVAVNSKGGRVEGMRRFANKVLRRGPAFASVADLRAVGIGTRYDRAWSDEVASHAQWFALMPGLYRADPLSFIGRAANEGQS